MAVTFPLSIPSWLKGWARCEFDIDKNVEIAPTGGGDLAFDMGNDLWIVDYQTVRLQPDQVEDFRSWLKLLEDGLQTFWGYNVRRPYTKAYPNGFSGLTKAGGGAFTGSLSVTAVNSDNKTLSLGGLPANFTVDAGTGIAWDYNGTARAYHQFAETQVSNSLGNIAAIEVRPFVRGGYSLPISANISQAMAKLCLVPKSKSFAGEPRGAGSFSFQAMQTVSP